MHAAVDARMMEQFAAREVANLDVYDDEESEAVYNDLMARQRGVRLGERGTLELEIDGQTVHLTPQKYPALFQQALAERQREEDPEGYAAAQAQAAAPPAEAAPFASPVVSEGVDFGEKTRQLGAGVVDFASRNVVEPIATGLREVNARKAIGEYERFGKISEESLESLSRLSTSQLRAHALPAEVIEAVQEYQNHQTRGSSSGALGGSGATQAIPGV
jgi:hypothetical protein